MPTGIYKHKIGYKRPPFSQETKQKMSLAKKGCIPWNKNKVGIYSDQTILKMREVKLGKISPNKGRKASLETIIKITGENHSRWIKDRTQLKKSDRHTDSAYSEWRKNVYRRDNFKCKINNLDCKGRIEAHHIFSWKDFPELRYNINNGITLCHFHHPRKKAEESRLSPYFKELILKQ